MTCVRIMVQKPSNLFFHTLHHPTQAAGLVRVDKACLGLGSHLYWRRSMVRMRVRAKILEGRNMGQHVQTQAKKDEVLQRVRGAASNGATKESRKNLEDL